MTYGELRQMGTLGTMTIGALAIAACGGPESGPLRQSIAEQTAGLGSGRVTITQVSSDGADAFFSSLDASGCVQSDAAMFVSLDATRTLPNGGRARSALVHVFGSVFDHCTGTPLLVGDGLATDLAFTLSPGLATATLSAPSIVFADQVSGQFLDLSMDLSWEATGGLQTGTTHDVNRDVMGFVIISVLRQQWREAVATGVITDGVQNLTPEPSLIAQIQKVQSGSVLVQRGNVP
ncbi:MAG: hypothetical protein IT384_14245 [Deltaproteobacteria bacterium]|nr:hypothetical protein [Deltaproteobacteria bacterium]